MRVVAIILLARRHKILLNVRIYIYLLEPNPDPPHKRSNIDKSEEIFRVFEVEPAAPLLVQRDERLGILQLLRRSPLPLHRIETMEFYLVQHNEDSED